MQAYWAGESTAQLTIESILGTTQVPVDIYFRTMEDMPQAELYALSLARGPVLDVGAGSGCHSLVLQDMDIEVVALEWSEGMAQIMRERGVQQVVHGDFWAHPPTRYQTLLCMMNGIGFVAHPDRLPDFFAQCDQLLAPGGQVLLDSTDLRSNVSEIEKRNLHPDYFGILTYRMAFDEEWSPPFDWLYADPELLEQAAMAAGWRMHLIFQAEDGHFLARLVRN